MLRLQGKYADMDMIYPGNKVDVYIKTVRSSEGRIEVSLHPQRRRPSNFIQAINEVKNDTIDKEEQPQENKYPFYLLEELVIGQPLYGFVVSKTKHALFLDCGIFEGIKSKERDLSKINMDELEKERFNDGHFRKPINGILYQNDLLEKYTLNDEIYDIKEKDTGPLIVKGSMLKVYVKSTNLVKKEFKLTLDPSFTAEKGKLQYEQFKVRQKENSERDSTESLEVGEERVGVVTKILEKGVKVGCGARKTGFLPLFSIGACLGNYIEHPREVVKIGTVLKVEVFKIKENGDFLLDCLEVLGTSKQSKVDQENSHFQKPEEKGKEKEDEDEDEGEGEGEDKNEDEDDKEEEIDDNSDEYWEEQLGMDYY